METIKFEDIKKANESILTIDVNGKDYAQVNERVKVFRMLYPQGSITTEIISLENGVCVIKATASNEQGVVLGTGHAYEKEGSTFINKTSYIENCETSAIGRCLASCGIGIDTSICSAEEVQNAIAQQSMSDEKAKLIQRMQELIVETESDWELIKKHYKVKHDVDLTEEQLNEIIKHLENKEK